MTGTTEIESSGLRGEVWQRTFVDDEAVRLRLLGRGDQRLNVMRIGYFVMGVGFAVTHWPLLFNRTTPWSLFEGITTYLLVAMGLLALLGLRYPVKMLPILLFESAWKLLWLAAVALPLDRSDRMDSAAMGTTVALLWVVIILAVIPWRHVLAQYVVAKGDPWHRRASSRPQ